MHTTDPARPRGAARISGTVLRIIAELAGRAAHAAERARMVAERIEHRAANAAWRAR